MGLVQCLMMLNGPGNFIHLWCNCLWLFLVDGNSCMKRTPSAQWFQTPGPDVCSPIQTDPRPPQSFSSVFFWYQRLSDLLLQVPGTAVALH